MLSDRDDVGTSDLVDRDVLLVSGVKVDVVGTNTSSDTALEILGLLDDFGGEVTRVEGGGDDDLGILDVLAKLGVGSILVSGDDELVTELVLDGTEQTGLLFTVLAGSVEDGENLREAPGTNCENSMLA